METANTRRRRTERGPRSKSGCRTCISKKVKCDEQHPLCRRCIRLNLQCEWPAYQPSISTRRRGLGPIKSRNAWTPSPILPIGWTQGASLNTDDSSQIEEISDCVIESPIPGHDHYLENGAFNLWFDTRETASQLNGPAQETDTVSVEQENDAQISVSPSPQSLFNFQAIPAAILFARNIGASYVPLLGNNDSRAVSFYRGVFAPLKSTREAASSAHFLFLNRALQNTMALHFLLAVSHNELAIHLGPRNHPPQDSWKHYQYGSEIFLGAFNPLAHSACSDHVATMLSFLYMYMFWMRIPPLNAQSLCRLSASVLTYVKSHGLYELCTGAGSSSADTVLLSRILTYLYDRDGFCSFFGCGGAFASYGSENDEKRYRIWQVSRSIFTSSKDDTTSGMPSRRWPLDSHILNVYFELISIHHDINCYSQAVEPDAPRLLRKIKRNLARAQDEHKSLSGLVAQCKRQGRTPPLMALVAVTFFHAIQIYFHRSRHSYFGQLPVPNEIQQTLSELVTAAFHTVATGPVQLLERFQWSLLIAGMETHDPVHLEWILANLSDPILKNLLNMVKEEQETPSISIKQLRQIIDPVSHGEIQATLVDL
ncbi:unnamed protein product [Penicillium nalgiovense]|uniref:Zn(2)-C6 fungal-type domain-containing protein n=1 Tax=Penicillium nalgiovense TaxID=60175 RepID=A0A9W4N8E1_PENNA|nr:unnamed protein product [Penicillium nalgiovense]CAG7980111.1 unnamed protein product [Penicillium nalgiovense]CAG7986443.1 unnamed protein product [Penicillium nalgiovense]CAG7990774.1 unnamed protein product [Penicillium nalgiovense]CAG7991404.1 unnamed protein product [Penicillium nalgiovense]